MDVSIAHIVSIVVVGSSLDHSLPEGDVDSAFVRIAAFAFRDRVQPVVLSLASH